MLAPERQLLTPDTIRLVGASLVFNAVLLGGVLWAFSAHIPPIVIATLFVLISIGEMLFWKAHARDGMPEEDAAPRIEALRRSDVKRGPGILDDTTGLYTRWYVDRRIKEEAVRCKRYGHSMAVVVLRVDEVSLTTFSEGGWQQRSLDAAQRAATVVREVDFSAAMSPFEFAICLVHCNRDGAYRALARMVERLPGYDCEAGIAVFPDEGYEASALIDVAKARLRPLELPRASGS